MAKSRTLSAGLAAIAIVFAAAASFLFITSDPTPRASAQTTQLASADAPRPLRVRDNAAADRMRVIDGDTFEDMREDITYRVVNIDTPETGARAVHGRTRTRQPRHSDCAHAHLANPAH